MEKPEPTMPATCGSCRYFVRHHPRLAACQRRPELQPGTCHRYPPPSPGGYSIVYAVRDWCAEHSEPAE